jgi:hypothetical protein
MRGTSYRNLFMTGDQDGNPQTYNKTYISIDKQAAWLYSPSDLRFYMETNGPAGKTERAIGERGVDELRRRMKDGSVDSIVEDAVLWSLIKGKTFVKLLWGKGGFQPYLIQPEVMGVEVEAFDTLDSQQCFTHTTWYTIDSFAGLVSTHPDRARLIRKAAQTMSVGKAADDPGNNMLKQVVLGGLYPYQAQSSGQQNTNRGFVNWMGAGSPYLSPEVAARLVQVDELWVKDDEREDYTTIQMISGTEDGVIYGDKTHRNLFADAIDYGDKSKKGDNNPNNPLKGLHPFVEFCSNPIAGYFWGMSEISRIALLQMTLNRRIDGINLILRRQEQPPRSFTGFSGVTQNAAARLNKPGGYMTEPNPTAKIETLDPKMPDTLFQSLHEIEGIFDEVSGITATLAGRGEEGVRAQAHAETLVRTGSPHFKDRALRIERSVSDIANLGMQIMKAQDGNMYTAWVNQAHAGVESKAATPGNVEEAPARTMAPVQFLLADIPSNFTVQVDAHSASPAFIKEHEEKMLALFKAGAMSKEDLIKALHPPREDELIAAEIEREAAAAEFAAKHPQEAMKKKSHH